METPGKRFAPPGMPVEDEKAPTPRTVVRPEDVAPDEKKAGVPRSAPKWESDARERVRAAIRKFSTPLANLAARDANEGDTRVLVTNILCDALGYDKYTDLTTEY